jgi:hypothetical protein
MGLDTYFRIAPKTVEQPSYNSTTEVGYFRKFNALHNWFVNNVQEGVDDCGYYVVPKEKLEQFLQILQALTPKNCDKLLPTSAGFFFGNTEYGDAYWSDVRSAIEQCSAILKNINFDTANLYHHSSW